MLKIFANYRTDEKILAVCTQDEVVKMISLLNTQFGGKWVFVDKLKPLQVLKFNDGNIYKGYITDITQYCDAIKNI